MKDPHEILNHLSPADALTILKILAENDEKLTARIGEIATQQLSSVDSEEIAGALYDKLDGLEVEEVWDRAGDKRHGYMDTSEAAEQMIDEVIEPYLNSETFIVPKRHKVNSVFVLECH